MMWLLPTPLASSQKGSALNTKSDSSTHTWKHRPHPDTQVSQHQDATQQRLHKQTYCKRQMCEEEKYCKEYVERSLKVLNQSVTRWSTQSITELVSHSKTCQAENEWLVRQHRQAFVEILFEHLQITVCQASEVSR